MRPIFTAAISRERSVDLRWLTGSSLRSWKTYFFVVTLGIWRIIATAALSLGTSQSIVYAQPYSQSSVKQFTRSILTPKTTLEASLSNKLDILIKDKGVLAPVRSVFAVSLVIDPTTSVSRSPRSVPPHYEENELIRLWLYQTIVEAKRIEDILKELTSRAKGAEGEVKFKATLLELESVRAYLSEELVRYNSTDRCIRIDNESDCTPHKHEIDSSLGLGNIKPMPNQLVTRKFHFLKSLWENSTISLDYKTSSKPNAINPFSSNGDLRISFAFKQTALSSTDKKDRAMPQTYSWREGISFPQLMQRFSRCRRLAFVDSQLRVHLGEAREQCGLDSECIVRTLEKSLLYLIESYTLKWQLMMRAGEYNR